MQVISNQFFGITDIGRVRRNNEDAFIAQQVADIILAAAIDGVGGYEGGEIAAGIAKECILQNIQTTDTDIIGTIRRALTFANEAIHAEKQKNTDTKEMACVLTMAVADLSHNKFYYGHVGDTRLYLFRDGGLIKITNDHSFVGYLEDSGRLNEEAAMRHPKRNEINKGLGLESSQNMATDYIDTGESPFLPGDVILLCSDGLTDMLDNKTICGILTNGTSMAEIGKTLIETANNAGGRDNITVVLVQNNKLPQPQTATRPTATIKHKLLAEDSKSSSQNIPSRSHESKLVRFFGLLSFLLLFAVGWLCYKAFFNHLGKVTSQTYKAPNQDELQFVHQVHGSFMPIVLGPFTSPITISDSIFFGRDSLILMGRGIRLICDSAFKGPAFNLGPASSYVMLDSITFENFNIAIISMSKSIHFKNVLFKNCKTPVMYDAQIHSDQLLNGTMKGANFYADSLAR